ncbi:MAG: hypothetical protein V3W44_10325 [Dehalococcoidales bacterium]
MSVPQIMQITVSKEVTSQEAAQALWDIVLDKLAAYPDLKVTGHYSTPFRKDPTP